MANLNIVFLVHPTHKAFMSVDIGLYFIVAVAVQPPVAVVAKNPRNSVPLPVQLFFMLPAAARAKHYSAYSVELR